MWRTAGVENLTTLTVPQTSRPSATKGQLAVPPLPPVSVLTPPPLHPGSSDQGDTHHLIEEDAGSNLISQSKLDRAGSA